MIGLSRLRARPLPVLAFALSAVVLTATHALAGGEPPPPAAPPAKLANIKFAAVTTDPATKSAYEEALAAAHRLAQDPGLLAQIIEMEAEAAAGPKKPRGRRPREISLVTSISIKGARQLQPGAVHVQVTDAEGMVLGSSPAVDFGAEPTVSLKMRWLDLRIDISIKVERAP